MVPPAEWGWRRSRLATTSEWRFSPRLTPKVADTRESWAWKTHISLLAHSGVQAEVPCSTDARGVDVVLDSLAGEFVDASLEFTA